MPVVITRTVSPGWAGFSKLTIEPSGRVATARLTPSDMAYSKIPGPAERTSRLTIAGKPFTVTVAGTFVAGATSQGTWKATCCCPFRLATLNRGAWLLLNAIETPANWYAGGPDGGVTTP